MVKKQIIKNMLLFSLWVAIGVGTVVLLVAAIQRKDAKQCTGIDITIKGVKNNFFVDKNDILNTITLIADGKPVGKPTGSFDLKEMERELQKNIWVKSVQLFFDNNERLQVDVMEREPVARIFTSGGSTFYIDSSIAMLPLSEKFSARLPVFTNFPGDKKVLSNADSNLLREILTISMVLQQDPFSMAMIDQVDITARRTFEMTPKFGNTVIAFGDAKNAAEKFDKLRLFYKEVMVKAGWNKYSDINVQYKNQVVARRKGAEDVKADSLRTLQLMQVIAENAAKQAGDSLQAILPDNERNTTSNSIILQSFERDDNGASVNTIEAPELQANTADKKTPVHNAAKVMIVKPALATVNKPVAVINKQVMNKKPVTNAGAKPVVKPKANETKKPKLLMPKPIPKKPAPAKEYNEYEQ